jgi:hypothetical protein
MPFGVMRGEAGVGKMMLSRDVDSGVGSVFLFEFIHAVHHGGEASHGNDGSYNRNGDVLLEKSGADKGEDDGKQNQQGDGEKGDHIPVFRPAGGSFIYFPSFALRLPYFLGSRAFFIVLEEGISRRCMDADASI